MRWFIDLNFSVSGYINVFLLLAVVSRDRNEELLSVLIVYFFGENRSGL